MFVDPEYAGLENVIRRVLATYTADDGAGHTASQLMNIQLNEPDPGTFIPYADLTLPTVLGWLDEKIDAVVWQAELDRRIYEAVNLELMPCPWD
jgi:hypothetical protein